MFLKPGEAAACEIQNNVKETRVGSMKVVWNERQNTEQRSLHVYGNGTRLTRRRSRMYLHNNNKPRLDVKSTLGRSNNNNIIIIITLPPSGTYIVCS